MMFKCPVCGGEQTVPDNAAAIHCEYCGVKHTVNVENEKKSQQQQARLRAAKETLLAILHRRIIVKRVLMWVIFAVLVLGEMNTMPGVVLGGNKGVFFLFLSLLLTVLMIVSFVLFVRFIKRDKALFNKYKEPFKNKYSADKQMRKQYKSLKYNQIEQLLERISAGKELPE